MSFNQDNFAPVGANSTDTPQIFSYKTTDSIDDVAASGYFDKKRFQLTVGDIIFSDVSGTLVFVHVLSSGNTVETKVEPAASSSASLLAYHDGTFTLSTNSAVPSFLTGDGVTGIPSITFDGDDVFELWDEDTFAVKNISGRTIKVTGDISWHPVKSGGGTARLVLGSESSVDNGDSWSLNQGSNRPQEINNDGDTFQTKVSFLLSWVPDQIVRFRLYNGGAGVVQLAPSSDPMLGETLVGHSVILTLQVS